MRTHSSLRVLVPAAVALLSAIPAPVRAANHEHAVLRIEVVAGARTIEGTCVLVQQEDRGGDTILYFLSSSRLFTGADAGTSAAPRRGRILRERATAIDVAASDIIFPTGDEADVVVIRVAAARGTLVPLSPVFERPPPGGVFVVAGFSADGARLTVPERVRSGSSIAVVEGDRDVEQLVGCTGAPAIVAGGMFGLLNGCAGNAAPSITPLSLSKRFISDHIPGLETNVSNPPVFTAFTRSVSRPLLGVQREAQQNGDVEVPIDLGPGAIALDATASITDARARHLADVPVLGVRNHSVKLGLTMAGTPLPPFRTTAGPNPKDDNALAQALVTVHVNVLVLPRQD